MKTKQLLRLAGIAAIISGLIFALIQFIHPADSLASMTTSRWLLAHVLTFLFPIFGLIGLTGIYIHQAGKSGYFGLVSYLVLSAAFILMICFGFYEAFVAPVLATEAPSYAAQAISMLDGKQGPKYIDTLYQLNGAFYLLGGLAFGLATLKAKVYPKHASLVLLSGLFLTLSAAFAPFMARPSAVVFGAGLSLIGVSLFKKAKTSSKLISKEGE